MQPMQFYSDLGQALNRHPGIDEKFSQLLRCAEGAKTIVLKVNPTTSFHSLR